MRTTPSLIFGMLLLACASVLARPDPAPGPGPGTASLAGTTIEAHAFGTVRQTFTPAAQALEPGGGLRVLVHPAPGLGPLQVHDPAADNYLRLESADPELRFTAATVADCPPMLEFRLAEGHLAAGEAITLIYGDTSGGGRGLRMPGAAADRLLLPMWVAFTAGDEYRRAAPAGEPLRVSGAALAGVRAVAPSVVRPGEPFTLRLRAEDRYGNRATPAGGTPLPGWRVWLGDELVAEVAAGGSALTLLPQTRISRTGVHRFTVESPDGTIRGLSNPVLVERRPGLHVYWGDLHARSDLNDGLGSPAHHLQRARADHGLDFIALAARAERADAAGDPLAQRVTHARSAAFSPFLSLESGRAGSSVLLREPAARGSTPPDGLRLAHGATNLAADNAPHLVEVSSVQGNDEPRALLHLDRGHPVAFTGGSDWALEPPCGAAHEPHRGPAGAAPRPASHRRGLTALVLPKPAPADPHARSERLFEALAHGRSYATSGARMILDVEVAERLDQPPARAQAPLRMRARVFGTTTLDTLSLLKNGVVIRERDLLTDTRATRPGDARFMLSFHSSSAAVAGEPSGWHHWSGELQVLGADLQQAIGYDDQNPLGQRWKLDGTASDPLRFTSATRGSASVLLLDLTGVADDARLRLRLRPDTARAGSGEDGGNELVLPIDGLVEGRSMRLLPAAPDGARIELRRLRTDTVMDAQVEWSDPGARPGDYYYLRATQMDGASAWSSPVRIADPRAEEV